MVDPIFDSMVKFIFEWSFSLSSLLTGEPSQKTWELREIVYLYFLSQLGSKLRNIMVR